MEKNKISDSNLLYSISIIIALLFVANLSLILYAVIFPYVWMFLSTAVYFLVTLGGMFLSSLLIGRMFGRPPSPIFGVSAFFLLIAGLFLGATVVVPYMNVLIRPSAEVVSVPRIPENRGAFYFSIKGVEAEPLLHGYLVETVHKRTGESISVKEETFEVVALSGSQNHDIWLTAEKGESIEIPGNGILHAFKRDHVEKGFRKAIEEACLKQQITPPENPLLLVKSSTVEAFKAKHALRFWILLSVLNSVLLAFAILGNRPPFAVFRVHL